jgi:hypothetical protein
MASLRISDNLSLPLEAVTQTFAILSKRGMGKTYTALVMVEEFLKSNLRVVVADPVGVCWGLRAGADGKCAGLPIVVLGGEHGDLPLEATAGHVVADLIVDEEISAVLDLSLMRKGEQVRFMTDFGERLYHRNRKPLHLLLDEADMFAPQRPLPGQQRMLGAVEDLVRRGRARGLGITLVTQRSAVLNKDVLTQVEVLIALRTIAPQDRSAIDEWVKVHGTPEQRQELMQSLPSLPIGTAWFWSSGWLDEFKRVKVRRRETFDSSATPKVGAVLQAPKILAKVDLARLQERMAAAIINVKSDEPRELRKRIADLTRQLNSINAHPAIQRVEIPVVSADDTARLREMTDTLTTVGTQLVAIARDINESLTNATLRKDGSAGDEMERAERRPPSLSPQPSKRRRTRTTNAKLGSGERKILATLAQHERGRTKTQLAVMSGYAHGGGAFNNYLSSLKSRGLIGKLGGNFVITEAGLAAGPFDLLPLGEPLADYWMRQLGKAERSILTMLMEIYPDAATKERIAIKAGYTPSGGGFKNALSKLRALSLVEGYKEIKVIPAFFDHVI